MLARFSRSTSEWLMDEYSHPEFLWIPPTSRTIVVYQQGKGINILDLSLMTEIEISEDANARA